MKHLKIILLLLVNLNDIYAFNEIYPGLSYKHLNLENPRQSIHILMADPHKVDIKIGVAHNKCASAQTTSEMAKEHNALAAINGGFFDFGCKNRVQDIIIKILDCIGYSKYKAFPIWTLNKDLHYYSISHNFTGAICWNNDEQIPFFRAIKTNIILTINNKNYEIKEFNKPNPKKATLYSSNYDKTTPFFHKRIDEIVIKNNKISKIYWSSRGKKKIPKNGWILVLPCSYKLKDDMVQVGDCVKIKFVNIQKPELSNEISNLNDKMDNILASTPLLIQNNTIPEYLKNYTSEFYIKRHPRSAVGVLQNGNWVFLVVDGRQKESEGFSIMELASFMEKLGCTGALNLDGGGSSTMVIQNTVVNSFSGREYALVKKERPISNVLLICSK